MKTAMEEKMASKYFTATELAYFLWASAVLITATDFLLGKELLEVGKWGLAMNAFAFPTYLMIKEGEKRKKQNAK